MCARSLSHGKILSVSIGILCTHETSSSHPFGEIQSTFYYFTCRFDDNAENWCVGVCVVLS